MVAGAKAAEPSYRRRKDKTLFYKRGQRLQFDQYYIHGKYVVPSCFIMGKPWQWLCIIELLFSMSPVEEILLSPSWSR